MTIEKALELREKQLKDIMDLPIMEEEDFIKKSMAASELEFLDELKKLISDGKRKRKGDTSA
jgi:hypothetical protein